MEQVWIDALPYIQALSYSTMWFLYVCLMLLFAGFKMIRGRGGVMGRGGPVRPLFNSGPAK